MSYQTAVYSGNIVALLLIWLISVPLIVIYTHKFYQYRTNLLMQHRDVIFVLSLNGLVIFGLITHRTMVILSETSLNVTQYPLLIQRFFTGVCIWGTLDVICIKSYLLYFQHQHHVSIQTVSWKKHIDSSSIDRNWYLRNKNKWGKFSYLMKWLSFPYALSVIFECLGEDVLGWIFMFIVHIIETVVPLLLVIIFSCVQGKFYDIYGIRKEMLSQLLGILICGIIYFIASYTINASHAYGESAYYDKLMSLPGNFVSIISFSFVALSSVCYPLYLLQQQSDGSEATKSMDKQPRTISLLSAIKDPTILSLFMLHLVKEFSTENLLMIIETIQVKYAYEIASKHVIKANVDIFSNKLKETRETKSKYLVVDFNPIVNETKDVEVSNQSMVTYFFPSNFMKVEIPNDLPTSDMLRSYEDDIKSQIAALYHKYIEEGSHLQVNLPFALREEVRIFMTKEDNERIEGDWFWVLDNCCVHILSLLFDPFIRFKKTEALKSYVQSQEYQEAIECVEFIHTKNKPEIHQVP